MTEATLGKLWQARMRRRGAFVQKIPASLVAGIADYLVAERGRGLRAVEAKRRQTAGYAYHPTQLTRAQRFFLGAIDAVVEGCATVLVLGPRGFVELPWRDAQRPLSQPACSRKEKPYDA